MSLNVNGASAVPSGTSQSSGASKQMEAYVENLPKMRPDFYKATLKRVGGDPERWTKWASTYMQFLWNQMRSMIEQAGKSR